MDVMDEQYLARLKYKASFAGISYIAAAPRTLIQYKDDILPV